MNVTVEGQNPLDNRTFTYLFDYYRNGESGPRAIRMVSLAEKWKAKCQKWRYSSERSCIFIHFA